MSRSEEDELNRRLFLKRLATGSIVGGGAVAAGFVFKNNGISIHGEDGGADSKDKETKVVTEAVVTPAQPGTIAVAKGENPALITKLAIDALGGMTKFISSGDKVLLKPNIGWDRRPNFAANTNPDVVAAIAKSCIEAGAGKVIVTDSPCNLAKRCFERSGIIKALSKLDVEVIIPTERDYVETDLGGEVLKTWPVLRALLKSDKVINIPIAKHHSSAVLSMGMKNWFGILGGGKLRGRLHQEMAQSIAELARFVKPCLTVMDAYRILFRNGPQGGSLNDTRKEKTVLASTDPVAVDSYGATLFGMTPDQTPYIPLATQMGLGCSDLESIKIINV